MDQYTRRILDFLNREKKDGSDGPFYLSQLLENCFSGWSVVPSPDTVGAAITSLVRAWEIEIVVRKDQPMLRLSR